MIGKPFINEVLSMAIEDYLKYKEKPELPEFSMFPVMVIRTLVFIYGELDIINPYITRNEVSMGGFNSNLAKYGFSTNDIEDFKKSFLSFDLEQKEMKCPNTAFLKIEKYLIQMYFKKQKMMNLSVETKEKFKTYLYLEENINPIIREDLKKFTKEPMELRFYFESVSFEARHNFTLEEMRVSTLIPEAYLLLGYSMDQIKLLNDIDLRNVNQQIYNFFKVDENAPDKDELLLKAVNYYKRYGNRVTSGNGFVDFVLFASILATALFIVGLIAINL